MEAKGRGWNGIVEGKEGEERGKVEEGTGEWKGSKGKGRRGPCLEVFHKY